MTHTKPILCVDFDGVIHSYTSGWKGIAEIPDPIVPGAVAFLFDAQRLFRVAIYSTRSAHPDGRQAMRMYLMRHWDGPGEAFDAIEWPEGKPSAFVTIDDRALTFNGKWPDLETLRAFKPWNKK